MIIQASKTICPRHGECSFADYPAAGYARFCSACVDAARATESAWRARWARWKRAGAAGIPSRYQRATLEHWVAETALQVEAKETALAWCARLDADGWNSNGLTLSGPPGVGKTHMAIGLLMHTLQRTDLAVAYCQWCDTLAAVKASFGRRDDDGAQMLDRLKTVAVLVVDELGVRQGSEYDSATLFDLIDYRYREEMPTIVCTNAPLDAIAATLGERVVDRLREMNEPVFLQGRSRRTGVRLPETGPYPIEQPEQQIEIPLFKATGD